MNKQEQQRRMELLRGVKEEERRRAELELPAAKVKLEALFDWLDEKLEFNQCDNSLRFTLEFASANTVDVGRLI